MAAIDQVPLAHRKRFGTAFLFMQDQQAIDWKAAAAAYDPKVKPESFSTVTKRALKNGKTSVEEHSETDLGRFAICFIFAENNNNVDWKKAAAAYDLKVKPESFTTVTKRALKKVTFAPERKNGVLVAGGKKSVATGGSAANAANSEAETASADGGNDGSQLEGTAKKGRKRKDNSSISPRVAKKIKAEAEDAGQETADDGVEDDADELSSQALDGMVKHESDREETDLLLSEEAKMIEQHINGGI